MRSSTITPERDQERENRTVAYIPTPDQIREMCEEIRADKTEPGRRKHSTGSANSSATPVVDLHTRLGLRQMAVDLQAIVNEVTLNPASMPYANPWDDIADDVAIAEVMNNANGNNPRTVNNETVETGDIRGNTTFAGFDGLTTAKQAWFEWLTVNGVIPVNAETLQQLSGIPINTGSIWAVGERTEMNAAMTALMQFAGSRAQEIADTLGASSVSPADVRDARESQ